MNMGSIESGEDKMDIIQDDAENDEVVTVSDLTKEKIAKKIKGPITPVVSDRDQGFHYTNNGKRIFGDVNEIRYRLELLASEGILESEYKGSYARCPNCGSIRLRFLLTCPHCGSSNIEKRSIVRHLKCGFIAPYNLFQQQRGGLKCPKCGEPISFEDGRVLDSVVSIYSCNSCKKSFTKPKEMIRCESCKVEFSPEDADIIHLNEYRLKTPLG